MSVQDATQVSTPRSVPLSPPLVAFACLLALYAAAALSGYGTDHDTYRLIRTGQTLLLDGVYTPSRPPGYLLPEVAIGAASLAGGYLLSNAVSVALGLGTLILFWCLLRPVLGEPDTTAIILLVGLSPFFVIASSSSIDYVYSLFFGMLGTWLLERQRPMLAAPAYGLAIIARLSNVLIVAALYFYFLYTEYGRAGRRGASWILAAGVATVAIAALGFVPAYVASGHSLAFLTYAIGDWSLFGYLARFVYKNVCLLGLLPLAGLVGSALWLGRRGLARSWRPACWAAVAMVALQETLFFKVPLEISYLLPLLFVVLPLWAYLWRPPRAVLYGMVALTVLYGFVVNVDLLQRHYGPNGEVVVDANVGLYLRRGVVIDDLARRIEVRARDRGSSTPAGRAPAAGGSGPRPGVRDAPVTFAEN